MIRRKVRLLIVMDRQDRVAGLITSTESTAKKAPAGGAKPRPPPRRSAGGRHHDPVDRLEAVDFDDLSHARVGHVLETLKSRGRQHALVIENVKGKQMVRGLLSLSQLCKQLGVNVETTEVAHTFIEIEQQLAHA